MASTRWRRSLLATTGSRMDNQKIAETRGIFLWYEVKTQQVQSPAPADAPEYKYGSQAHRGPSEASRVRGATFDDQKSAKTVPGPFQIEKRWPQIRKTER